MNHSDDTCNAPLPPQAVEGFLLFNAGEYFEAHEALEDAWKAEKGKIRELYKGILQIAVTYLHITRGNYPGAVKVYARSQKWLRDWSPICRGIHVEELRVNAAAAIRELERLGEANIAQFDATFLKPIRWEDVPPKKTYICDRCGHEMYEKNCKVTCPNCGNRFDCSDLNIYFD
jgi:predicted metal-dependent hydrolase